MPYCLDCNKLVRCGPRCISCAQRIAQTGRKHSLETRLKMSLSMKGKKHKRRIISKEYRLHLSQALKGRPSPNKGNKYSEERKREISIRQQNQSSETRTKIAKATRKNWKNPASTLCQGVRRYWENKVNREKHGQIAKKNWTNSEYRNKVTRAAMSNQHFKPNRQETTLNNILAVHFPNEWKFVGDGQLIIEGKCPDFMNINGKKALIELFGDYWHRGQNPEDRIKVFEPYGYSTLIIWEHELKDQDSVLEKVRNAFYN